MRYEVLLHGERSRCGLVCAGRRLKCVVRRRGSKGLNGGPCETSFHFKKHFIETIVRKEYNIKKYFIEVVQHQRSQPPCHRISRTKVKFFLKKTSDQSSIKTLF